MKSLGELFNEHGSDKEALHGYAATYERYFEPIRMQPLRLLEIGIAGSASLRAWSEYFTDGATEIWGIDHTEACVKAAIAEQNPGIFAYCLDASFEADWKALATLAAPEGFNIVIDDASHNVWAQAQAFKFGWPLLNKGGFWCVEDLHTTFRPEYKRDNHPNGLHPDITFLDIVSDECLERLHEFGANQCGRQTTADIEFCHFEKSLVILKKR